MADAYARISGPARRAHGAPGLRADQRDDRHHRGGEEPHAAARARRRTGGRRRAVELPDRPGRPGHARSARWPSGCTGRTSAAADVVAGVPDGRASSAGPSCSTCPLDVQAAPAPDRRRVPAGARAGAGPAGRRRRSRSWPSCSPRRERPVFIAGRGARGAGRGAARRSATASGALLATSAVAQGPVRRRPVGARHLRRLRLAAGRRADRRRRPGRRLGLRAEHVDDPARRADRLRRHGWCRSTSTPTRSARTGRVDLGVLGDVARHRHRRARRARAAAPATAPTRSGRRSPRGCGGATCRTTTSPAPTASTRARSSIALDDLLPARAGGRGRLRQLHGLPERVPVACRTRPGSASPRRSSRSGWGWRRAIGAALARPDRLPVAALGDGGALMGVAELETVVRLGLPMVVVVYDDRGYGAEVHHFPDADHATVTLPGDRPGRDRPRLRVRGGDGPGAGRPRRASRDWVAGPRAGAAAGAREDRLGRRLVVARRGVPRAGH